MTRNVWGTLSSRTGAGHCLPPLSPSPSKDPEAGPKTEEARKGEGGGRLWLGGVGGRGGDRGEGRRPRAGDKAGDCRAVFLSYSGRGVRGGSGVGAALCLSISRWGSCPRTAMTLEGLEMVAVLVVLVLFVKVLEQFGLFEPVSLEGNPSSWAHLSCYLGTGLCYLDAWGHR